MAQAFGPRQVIVIIDACHSGGLDQNAKHGHAKDFDQSKGELRFDFLDREAARLKDIGQGDISLLTAAEYDLGSLESPDAGGGVFTMCLNQTLKELPGPLGLDQVFLEVKARMARWFADHKARLDQKFGKPGQPYEPHHPQMANYGSRMPILKP